MVSWKLSLLVVLAVVFVLTLDVEARRGARRRNQVSNSDDEDNGEGNTAVTATGRARGGRRRGRNGANQGGAAVGVRRRGRGGRNRGRGGRNRGNRRRGRRPGRGGRRPGRGGRRGNRRRQPSEMLINYANSNGRFGLSVYREMAQSLDNFAFSPLGVYTSASLMQLAANRGTKRQISSVLSRRVPVHQAFKSYNNTITFGNDGNTHLSMATGIYTQSSVHINPRFMTRLGIFYRMNVSRFHDASPESHVNQWVSSRTLNEINEIVMEGEVASNDLIMMLNAVYFQGQWEEGFDEASTALEPFTNAQSEVSDVNMMSRSGLFYTKHSADLRATAVEIPFKGDKFSMFVLLPDEGVELSEVESSMNQQRLNETMSNANETSAYNLKMPKFTIDTHQSMKAVLQQLGITQVFNSGQARLRKMTTARNAFVSDVMHRSVFNVTESGGERDSFDQPTTDFSLNRPFIFFVRDVMTGVNVLMGRYVNPEGDDLVD